MQRRLLFLAYFFVPIAIGSINCFSQQYPFVHYTPREGLVNNRARFIYQDSKGKLYISTYGGLSIYDGSRFTNYTRNNGLVNDLINDVVEMGEDSIWVIPNSTKIHCIVKGVLKDFTPADGYSPILNQIIKSSNGNVYALGEEGLFCIQNKRFIRMPMDTLFNGERIKTFLQGAEFDNKLFIFSNPDYKLPDANLLVYDLVTNKLIACAKDLRPSCVINAGKELWIATYKGLHALEKIDEKNKTINLTPLYVARSVPKDVPIYDVYIDRQDNVWLATPNGVYKIKNGQASLFTTANGLTTNFQISIFQDQENNMWFINQQTGLSKLSNQQLAYYPSVKSGSNVPDVFIRPLSDSVWMYDAYHRKMVLLLPGEQKKEYEKSGESPSYPGIFISANKKWLLSGTTIYQWKQHTGDKHYSLNLYYKDSNSTGFGFSCALADKKGNLVAASGNLVVVAGNKVLKAPIHNLADQLTVDKDNRVWVVDRSNQMYCFQISGSGDATQLSLLKSFSSIVRGSPRSITADKSGNIWIGSRDLGLFCLHFNGLDLQSSRQITTLNGLSENFISYLFCDNENNIWACTPSGLDKIKISGNSFLVENITTAANLYFPITKIQQTASGLFWIISNEGLITYNPSRAPVNNWKPQLSFSEILVNNANQPASANRELRYFQNNITFQLSAPTYIDEKQTRFSFLLEGSGNENWSTPSANASINLVNLPPGHYTLRAKAVFLHGLYPNSESVYSFTILPPWWQTIWFKVSLALLISGLLFLSIRFYFKRKLLLQLAWVEKKRAIEKERTRIATDMHDDLGSGLSRIKFLSETIGMKKQQHLPIEEEISSIRMYSHEMIDKMGEIVWALNEKNDTLEDLLSYTRSYAVEYLQENGINCKVNEPDEIPHINVSGEFRRNIYLTVKEILHNIVKHAQATEVVIDIGINHRLTIVIKDNGIGIDTMSMTKTGNGLGNMNARMRGLNGSFKIENNEGTQIYMSVPLEI